MWLKFYFCFRLHAPRLPWLCGSSLWTSRLSSFDPWLHHISNRYGAFASDFLVSRSTLRLLNNFLSRSSFTDRKWQHCQFWRQGSSVTLQHACSFIRQEKEEKYNYQCRILWSTKRLIIGKLNRNLHSFYITSNFYGLFFFNVFLCTYYFNYLAFFFIGYCLNLEHILNTEIQSKILFGQCFGFFFKCDEFHNTTMI